MLRFTRECSCERSLRQMLCRGSMVLFLMVSLLGIAECGTTDKAKSVAATSVQTKAEIADEFYGMARGIWIDKENAFLSDEGELWCMIRMIDRGGMISWFLPVEGNNPSRFQIKEVRKISDGRYKVTMCLLGGSKMVTEEVDLINYEYASFGLNNTKSMFWRASYDVEQKSLDKALLALIEYCKNYQ